MPHFHVNGTDIHYHTQGHGPTILMIHPPFLGSRIFNYLRTDLSMDHRVVTIDVRGHGHSEAGTAPITIPLIVEDVKQVMDKLGIAEAYVCGYSVGAMPAFEAMLTHPERFKGGIMLSGTSELVDKKSRSAMRAASITNRIRAKEAVVLPFALNNADSRTTFHVLHKEGMAGMSKSFREYSNACLQYSCTDRLRRVAAPVLIMCGEKDPTYVDYGRMLHDHLAVSDLYIVKDCTHHIPTKAPDKCASTIRTWIAKHEGREAADTFFDRQGLDRDLLEQGVLTERQADFGNPQGL